MINLKLTLVWLAVLTFGTIANGQDIKAILLIDTEDSQVKEGCEQDKLRIKNYIGRIAKEYSTNDPDIHILEKENFTKRQFHTTLENLEVNPDDIVFFYFSGHGFLDERKGFLLNLKSEKAVFNDFKKEIEDKGAKLNFILTDCCKKSISSRGALDEIVLPVDDDKINENFKMLLTSYKGSLTATSCQDKQGSYMSEGGSYFTYCLLSAISYYVEQEDPTWQSIMAKAKYDTRNLAKTDGRVQVPDVVEYPSYVVD